VTPARFRQLALALPLAVEGAHHGHPDFRIAGRVFASLHPDGRTGMVKVPPDEQAKLCAAHAEVFVPARGAWGRAGCTLVQLAKAPLAATRDALTLAWQAASAGPPPRRR
jgi:hypothetical protein